MKKTILIVDDDRALTTLFEYYLKPVYKGEVICLHDGQEAVSYCEKNVPDLILMDLHMPGMDGLTAIRKIREMKINSPILVLSSFSFLNGKECMDAGATQVYQKPIQQSRFYELIRQYTSILQNSVPVDFPN